MSALFPYQADAVDATAVAPKVVYNAFEPGLGKSCVALKTAERRGARRVLIACPLTATHPWKRQIKLWWTNAPPVTVIRSPKDAKALAHHEGIFLVTYGLLSRSGPMIQAILAAPPMDFTIIDEAHFVKNAQSNRTKALLVQLRPNLGRAFPMSATPAPNHAGELYPVLRSLRPDLIASLKHPGKPMRESEFVERYCVVRSIRVAGRMVDTIVGSKNVDELRARLAGFFMRETKARVLKDLPPMMFDVLPVDVANPDRFKTVGQLAEAGEADEDVLEAAAKVANATLYAELGLAKAPMVAEYVIDMLEGGAKQVLVWAVHHDVIDLLEERLGEYGVSRVDGRVPAMKRDLAIERFLAGDSRVFLGQIQAAGTAITLSGGKLPCHDAIFAESSFSPFDNYQAACRIHRIGQHDAVLARFASAAGTFDDRIQEILARKAKDFSDLFDKDSQGVKN